MRFKKVIKLFESGNVSVFGLRGRGKDLLMSNVVIRRKLPYVSNIDYGDQFYPFDYDALCCGSNTYQNFISGSVQAYEYPYPDGTDVYLSDAGIYFPAQYCNELNKRFPYMSVFQAISRHVGDCNFHFNAQNLNRVWDKIREQSDIYICCNWCLYLKGIVLQKITVYDRYDSAVMRMKPFSAPLPMFANKEMRLNRQLMKSNFDAAHGEISSHLLLYVNKSKYNTRQFREILKEGSADV